MRTESWLTATFAVLCVTFMSGCPGELDDPSRFADGGAAGACTDAPREVFAKSCVSGCHSASAAATSGDLDLESAGIVARLKDKKAKGGAGLLVDSSDVDQSVMLTKLKSPPPFGGKMPFGGTPLTDGQIRCVRDWLVAELKATGPSDGGANADAGARDAAADGGARDAAAAD
jgi:hypothetical protein